MTEEENIRAYHMDSTSFSLLRKGLLQQIEDHRLPIDVLEEELEKLKKQEYLLRVQELSENSLEEKKNIEAELDKKCSRLFMNLIKGVATAEHLLHTTLISSSK